MSIDASSELNLFIYLFFCLKYHIMFLVNENNTSFVNPNDSEVASDEPTENLIAAKN